jgi:DNA repair protein RadC
VVGTNVVQLAQQLLVEQGGWPGLLRADYGALRQRHGMGEAKTAALKAALEIGRRLLLTSHEQQRFQIKSPSDAVSLLMLEMSHLDQEHLRTVLLDTKNRVQVITTTIQMQSAPSHSPISHWPRETQGDSKTADTTATCQYHVSLKHCHQLSRWRY